MKNAEYIEVTPEIAKQWLSKNKRNRYLNHARRAYMANVMESGLWKDTGDTIKFYSDGNIADGQTRLSAVVDSGCTIKFLCVFDIDDEAALGIDMHRTRTLTDVARIGTGEKWFTTSKIAMIRFLFLLDNPAKKFNVNVVIGIHENNPDAVERIDYASNNLIRRKGFGSAPFLCAVATAYNNVDMIRLDEFCNVVNTGFPKSLDDIAAITIREHALLFNVHSNYLNRKKYFLRTQKAIEQFCIRSRTKKWIVPSIPLYPNII